MRPYKLIKLGDIYQRPEHSIFWVVVDKSDEERLVGLACSYQHPAQPNIVWKKSSDSLFSYLVDSLP